MSVNSYLPHVLVLPEDDANREMANGFLLDTRVNDRKVQVLPVAGGWQKVIASFVQDHVNYLQKYPERRIVLLLDFDDDVANRSAHIKSQIPPGLSSRVFVLGVASEPERLKASCNKKLEPIGEALAGECAENAQDLWNHPLMLHNAAELARLKADVKPFLF